MKPIHKSRKILETRHYERVFTKTAKQKLHLENIPGLYPFVNFALTVTLIKYLGRTNAENVCLDESEFVLDSLPAGFDKTRILLITDLHIDGIDILADRIISIVDDIEYDFCILGGDYRFHIYGKSPLAERRLRRLAARLKQKSRVFGILGNHDEYAMAPFLADLGVEMLINENICLEKNGDHIYLTGLDDCHYYDAAELSQADADIPAEAFKIMLCHSPELYKEAAEAGYSLYLCGHTHGGQICLPGGIALTGFASIPRSLIKGRWKYHAMPGYTSRGVGTSGVPARFFCPPEITMITLRKENIYPRNKIAGFGCHFVLDAKSPVDFSFYLELPGTIGTKRTGISSFWMILPLESFVISIKL